LIRYREAGLRRWFVAIPVFGVDQKDLLSDPEKKFMCRMKLIRKDLCSDPE